MSQISELPCIHLRRPREGGRAENQLQIRAVLQPGTFDYILNSGLSVITGELVDVYAGAEDYEDVTGTELALRLSLFAPKKFSIDTEWVEIPGAEDRPWSLQISVESGSGWMLRLDQSDFSTGISALQQLADDGALVIMHSAMSDIPVCRTCGLELRRANIYDTMYGAYLLRLEPQGLKPLAWRGAGMEMTSHAETVGGAGRERQIAYLADVAALDWPKPDPRVISENDGTQRVYKPQSISKRAFKILQDIASGKVNTEGEPPDPYARWHDADDWLRAPIEDVEVLGPMLPASIEDVQPLQRAIDYGIRDADATLRIQPWIDRSLFARGLGPLMHTGMRVLPVFEEMQATGMPASRARFIALRDDMTEQMADLQREISQTYYAGAPFNPKSPLHVASLLRRRGLEPAMYTDTGAASTSKQSIEHLRVEDPAIDLVMRWRECQHTRDMFCATTLALMDPSVDVQWVRCRIKTTRTTTRRLATADPNLLAVSKHSELGKRIRNCYVAPPGWVFCEADQSQVESRVLAHESRDPILCAVFNEGRDIHAETASRLFGVPQDAVTKNQRTFAKRLNFGLPYGVSEYGMETQLRVMGVMDWDRDDCRKFKREWLSVYKGCARYFDQTEREVAETGEVRDHWGMLRYLPGVWSDDAAVAAEARRMAVNHKIQGGAQGMLQGSLVYLREPIRELQESGVSVKWLLSIHDSVIMLVEEGWAETVGAIVVDGLVNHSGLELRVPMAADMKTAETWGGL